MKPSMRPHRILVAMAFLSAGAAFSLSAGAQSHSLLHFLQQDSPLLIGHSSSPGYLGVDLADIDNDKAQALKLREVRGALVTLIDHDAPAGQIGLHVNDVILKLNGQNVESAEQLRRMLHELPAGRKISLEISREGNLLNLNTQLADRRAMEQEIWNRLGHTSSDDSTASPAMGILSNGDAPVPSGFHMPSLFGSSLNVGVMVEPLTTQMAEYLGVSNGLMIKQVAHKSEAANAGLKAFDIILKVGPESIKTLSDWDRSLRANRGKSVPVTILRDKKQQTLNLEVDPKHHQGLLDGSGLDNPALNSPAGINPASGDSDPQLAQTTPTGDLDELSNMLGISPEELAKAAPAAANAQPAQPSQQPPTLLPLPTLQFPAPLPPAAQPAPTQNFQIDRQQFDQLQQQMKQTRQQMQEQMDQMQRQMQQMQKQSFGGE